MEYNLNINFYSKMAARSQVVVQHCNLTSVAMAERTKKYWDDTLGTLKDRLEG